MTHTLHKRTPAECPFRRSVPLNSDDQQTANVCELVKDITGVTDARLAIVQDEMCAACCDSFTPTATDWNSVIASVVHIVAEQITVAHGVDGCSAQQAEALKEAAVQNLPVVLPEEDDGVDDIQQVHIPQQLSVQQLQQILPPPDRPKSAVNAKPEWAIGVTTAPRRQSTLTTSLDSLIASGWERPHLFVDGHVSIDPKFHQRPITRRPESIGAWPAWVESLRSLLMEYPTADTIAIVQDDALFPAVGSIRDYVESVLWPEADSGILSLYTSTDDMQTANRWRPFPGVWKLGAVAMVFSRNVARRLMSSADSGDLDFVPGTAGIDTRIGIWADQQQIQIWHPSPSLVQHIGQVSSVWKTSRAVGLRRADRFLGNEIPHESPL